MISGGAVLAGCAAAAMVAMSVEIITAANVLYIFDPSRKH